MIPIEPPDIFHLRAVQGWLELGNPGEAAAELDRISPLHRHHPLVLQVCWEIHAALGAWEPALETAATLVQRHPGEVLGWIHRSYSLHELKRTAEARDNLLLVVNQFPASATIRYNLACYECQLGRLPQARRWLKQAFGLGNASALKAAALEDKDLAPLRDDIGRM